jgi:hypothetical protein
VPLRVRTVKEERRKGKRKTLIKKDGCGMKMK